MGRNPLRPLNPLPWCEELGLYYWEINIMLCWSDPDWRAWQSKKDMSEIIPVIDEKFLTNRADDGILCIEGKGTEQALLVKKDIL